MCSFSDVADDQALDLATNHRKPFFFYTGMPMTKIFTCIIMSFIFGDLFRSIFLHAHKSSYLNPSLHEIF